MAIHITDFGGLAPKIADRNLNPNIAHIAENVDLDQGTLRPFRKPNKVSDNTGQSLFVHDCCFITGSCDTHFTNFGFGCDEIIVSTGIEDYPVYSKASDCPPNWKRLGYSCNMSKPTANPLQDVVEDFSMEYRSYYYTLVNEMGWESQPSYPSEPIRVNTDKEVVITGIATDVTDDYEYINIYRSQNPLDYGVEQQDVVASTFLLVGSIAKGKTSFIDGVIIADKACVTEEYDSPPDDLYSIDMWREGRLIGLSGNTLVMTERNLPYAWNAKYTIAFDEAQAQRVIATDKKAYVLTDGKPFVVTLDGECGDNKKALSINDTLEPLPIISQQSAVAYLGGVVYASNHGLVLLNNLEPQIVTQDYYTNDQWQALHPHTMKGVIHEGYYYGVTDTTCIRFRLPDNIYSSKSESRLTTISLLPTAMDVSAQGRLYMVLDDDDYSGVYEWEQGSGYLTMHWQSKVNTEAGITRYSAWKVVAKGAGNIVSHGVDTRPIQNYTHKLNRPVRLPMGYHGIDWVADIVGTNEVLEYHLAPSVRELANG